MANTHGYVSTMRAACENVDSFNRVGISITDIDNGVFVTLGAITRDNNQNVQEFNYAITAATAATTGSVWLVNTPEVGSDIEMQAMSDPRYFYNKANRPVSLKYINPKTDIIEVDANCFVNTTLPTTSQGYVTIGANGKLAAASAAADAGKPYFSVVGFNTVAVGMGEMKTVLLQCEAN